MAMKMDPPLAFFVFNRPDTTAAVLSAIRGQTVVPKRLLVFADAARNREEEGRVREVRGLIEGIGWTEVTLVRRERNFGCAKNIIGGLDEVFAGHEMAVILEDDTLPSKCFYEAMCVLLDHYREQESIFAVGGYPSIRRDALPGYSADVILSPRFSCWGWATWTDRWRNAAPLLHNYRNPFGSPESVPTHAGHDFPEMARYAESQPGLLWDIPLALYCLHNDLHQALTKWYLINNIGADSGVHGTPESGAAGRFMRIHSRMADRIPSVFPATKPDEDVDAAVQQYVREILLCSGGDRGVSKVRRIWSGLLGAFGH